MDTGDRLRVLRKEKNYSQGEIEKRTGLRTFYISRVEHGHTVPGVETLEEFARALEIPIYQLFCEGEDGPEPPDRPQRGTGDDIAWDHSGNAAVLVTRFRRLLSKTKPADQKVLMLMAQKMASLCRAK
jgi:transcriptional regulator with XRE-family HTH domain